jgi:hypothetical protein
MDIYPEQLRSARPAATLRHATTVADRIAVKKGSHRSSPRL